VATELIRISSKIAWQRAEVHPLDYRLETTLDFDVNGSPFRVTISALPGSEFFAALPHLRCVSIWEFSSHERGWVEPGRYDVRLNDDDDYDKESVSCDCVKWGSPETVPNSSEPPRFRPSRDS
jgi:hypothetical protein